MKRIWKIILLILSWVSVGLYIWDCVTSFLAYNYWMKQYTETGLKQALKSWLAFSIIGTILATLLVYNTLMHTIRFFLLSEKLHAIPHQIYTFIAFYCHEIPKSVIQLVIMILFWKIVDDPMIQYQSPITTAAPVYLLNTSKYDHIYFKIIFDALKMILLLIIGILEFIEIIHKDRKIVLMVLNCTAEAVHIGLLIAATVIKIQMESK